MAYIDEINYSIDLDGNELCPFITHFGNFGDIEIYDQIKKEILLNTKEVYIDCFYLMNLIERLLSIEQDIFLI